MKFSEIKIGEIFTYKGDKFRKIETRWVGLDWRNVIKLSNKSLRRFDDSVEIK